jgi:hypothetical protein
VIYVIYIDDILIYSFVVEDHTKHIRFVLNRLRKYSLYAKLAKCDFHIPKVDFLGYRIGIAGISINIRKV